MWLLAFATCRYSGSSILYHSAGTSSRSSEFAGAVYKEEINKIFRGMHLIAGVSEAVVALCVSAHCYIPTIMKRGGKDQAAIEPAKRAFVCALKICLTHYFARTLLSICLSIWLTYF